jgi:group I intron endonuclease
MPYKADKIIGIYSITNKINGKIYIGQSWDIAQRWRAHKSTGHNRYLDRAYKKHGLSNFEFKVIEQYSKDEATQEILDKMEIFYINIHNSTNYKYGYNLREGGNGGRMLDDAKKIISIKSKAMWKNPEIRERIVAGLKNRPKYTEEQKRKISESSKGRTPTAKCIEMSIKAKRGIRKTPITKEQSQKISKALKLYNLNNPNIQRKNQHKAKYTGVYQYGNSWKAWGRLDGKLKYIGCYDSEDDAYIARCRYVGSLNALEG